ncbi:aldehyde dehydrogenase family protein [Virgibacillus salexigens]|uniref:Aldehyde dehydrogenase n=1 Tax=Virgibacillus kapii TaxID=1638645 RepID=A0ABQ2DZD8_9BACI|nr:MULTISPECIES: aldehyde dehydrogenase family protein [Virgibacillus]MYL42580.1 aldehyde dehydrogenase family protein [Virgibacillus massiliensis]GGJ73941.1 aldehyde dehydrogenase [Virgibacillus kapii]
MVEVQNEIKQYHNIINGEQVSSSTRATMDSIDPSTGNVWAEIPLSTKDDVEQAVSAANDAFTNWSSLSSRERGDYLRSIGDLIPQYGEELLTLETKNNGWVLDEFQYLTIVLKQIWYDAAGSASLIGGKGETVQLGTSSFGYTLREPFGVVLGILPWNAPLFTFTIKAAYALAAGNTVVIKPSEHAAVASLRYGEILAEVLPLGVINVISGLGSEIGESLVSHKQVKKVSLTGSKGTAQAITKASVSTLKPLIFELGGKSPNIIFEDANFEQAINGVIHAIYTPNAGQICAAGSRILIQRTIYDELIAQIKEKMQTPGAVKYGDTLNTVNTMGPIANLPQYHKVCSYIELGQQEGEIVFGGRTGGHTLLPDKPEFVNGYWVEPTLFKVDSNSYRICQEEIFGPIAVAIPFDTEEEAVKIANDTNFGLAAGVWTSNLGRAHRMIKNIESGNVWVNTYSRVGADLPFGGFKESGYGTDTILEYTREKSCVIEIEDK